MCSNLLAKLSSSSSELRCSSKDANAFDMDDLSIIHNLFNFVSYWCFLFLFIRICSLKDMSHLTCMTGLSFNFFFGLSFFLVYHHLFYCPSFTFCFSLYSRSTWSAWKTRRIWHGWHPCVVAVLLCVVTVLLTLLTIIALLLTITHVLVLCYLLYLLLLVYYLLLLMC